MKRLNKLTQLSETGRRKETQIRRRKERVRERERKRIFVLNASLKDFILLI